MNPTLLDAMLNDAEGRALVQAILDKNARERNSPDRDEAEKSRRG